MNENLFRTQFDQLETTEKQALMERLAARYDNAARNRKASWYCMWVSQ